MKPIKIALIIKNENGKKRDDRSMGYFSYAVDDLFTWEHFIPGKNFTLDLDDLKDVGYDLVFHEDYPYGDYVGDSIPVIFLDIDSTLSKEHYDCRLKQSMRADRTLVDHDEPKRFKDAIQFPYCVNDKMFYKDERERTIDIAYHCSSSAHAGIDERKRIKQLLKDLSVKHNWTLNSGVLPLEQYAESFRNSKIVVNQSRTPTNRPHRIFDAMACGSMVLTSPLPEANKDGLLYELNYETYFDDLDLELKLSGNLTQKNLNDQYYYSVIAEQGYNTVIQNHTWSIRAKQLREIVNKEFGI